MSNSHGRLPCDCPLLPLPRLVQQNVLVRRIEIGANALLDDGTLFLDPARLRAEVKAPVLGV